MKIKWFFMFFTFFVFAILVSACGSSEPQYETPQDWKNGNSYSGTYTAKTSFVWYMQTDLVTIRQDKLRKVLEGDNQTSEEYSAPTPSTEYAKLPLINEYSEYIGVMDNPDTQYSLTIEIYAGYVDPCDPENALLREIRTTLDKNQSGLNYRAKSYLIAGQHTAILKSHNPSVKPLIVEFEVTGVLGNYKGIPCYWDKFGGTGNWGQSGGRSGQGSSKHRLGQDANQK